MNTVSHPAVKLAANQIHMPAPGYIERMVSGYFRRKGEQYIRNSIHDYAMTQDGGIDNELADHIRREITKRIEVSLSRDVLEPTGWVGISGVVLGGGALVINKEIEGKVFTRTGIMAAAASVALGACLDLFRVTRRFQAGMDGALRGALRAAKEDRSMPRGTPGREFVERTRPLNASVSPESEGRGR